MKSRLEKVTLPTYLASALINGDDSGLEESDQPALDAALKIAEDFGGGQYIDVGEDSWFAWSNDLPGRAGRMGGDVAEYTIVIYEEEDRDEPFQLPDDDDPDGFEEMVNGYLESALFTATEDDPEGHGAPLDERFTEQDFSDEAREVAEKDVAAFIRQVNKDSRWQVLHDKLEEEGLNLEPGAEGFELKQIGHDIWFTMNGHGVGFWEPDREKMYGKRTAKIFDDAAGRSERNVYVGDDGELHIS